MRLDVLDLHGNMASLTSHLMTILCVCVCVFVCVKIREVENLCHLSHLRVLNLAGNDITCVTGLAGLTALTELNFRRNRITHVVSLLSLSLSLCVCVCVCVCVYSAHMPVAITVRHRPAAKSSKTLPQSQPHSEASILINPSLPVGVADHTHSPLTHFQFHRHVVSLWEL